jgi:hypothetical protein
VQQVGSSPHTKSQHDSSSQAGVEWGSVQEPAAGSPQGTGFFGSHWMPASTTQVKSQEKSQQ